MADTQEEFKSIWADALEKYHEGTEQNLHDSKLPRPSTYEELIQLIEEQDSGFKKFRSKNGSVFKILKTLTNPIVQFGSAIAADTSSMYPPASICLSSILLLFKAAQGVSAAFDAIEELLESIASSLSRFQIYSQENISLHLRLKMAKLLALLLEVVGLSTQFINKGLGPRFKKFGRNFFIGKNSKIENIARKIGTVIDEERGLVIAETSVNVKSQRRQIDQLVANVTARQEVMQQRSDKEKFQHEDDMAKKLLKPGISYSDRFRSIQKSRAACTCDWVLNDELLQAWLYRQIPVFYLSGMPGAGKSFLAAHIIEHLQTQFLQGASNSSHISVVYFFFKENDSETSNIWGALRNIAYQISQQDSAYYSYLAQKKFEETDISSLSSAWERLFVEYFIKGDNGSRAYIVLDGLDETVEDQRIEFLPLLNDIHGKVLDSRIQIALTGRPHVGPEILEAVDAKIRAITIENQNKDDIVQYIKASLARSRDLRKLSSELKNEVVNTLTSKAQGMFLYVDLMMRELGKKTRPKDVERALEHAPQGLDSVLRHVLEGFSQTIKDEGSVEDLNTMLLWTAVSHRPLTLQELVLLLKLNNGDDNDIINLEYKLRKDYASFFILYREDGLNTADLEKDVGNTYSDCEDSDSDSYGSESETLAETTKNLSFLDAENVINFDSPLLSTTVELRHASYEEFLRDPNKGKIRASTQGYFSVGVDTAARALALETCCRLLCEPRLAPETSLTLFAGDAWGKLVHSIRPHLARLDSQSKTSITGKLLRILCAEDVIDNWAVSRESSHFHPDMLEGLRVWFSDDTVQQCLKPEDSKFIKGCLEKPPEFLRPVCEVLIRCWLQRESSSDEESDLFKVILMLVTWINTGKRRDVDLPAPMADIKEAITFLNLEKTALSHQQVGYLYEASHYKEEALHEFETALLLDSTMHRCRIAILKQQVSANEHDKAISTSEKLIEYLKDHKEAIGQSNNGADLLMAYELLTEVFFAHGNYDESLRYARSALDVYPTSVKTLNYVVEIMYAKKDYRGVIDSLKVSVNRHSDLTGDNDELSMLYQCMQEFYDPWFFTFSKIAASAVESGGLPWLQRQYRAAYRSAKKLKRPDDVSLYRYYLGTLHGKFGGEIEKAANIYQKIINGDSEAINGGYRYKANRWFSWMLQEDFMRYKFNLALECGFKSPKARTHIQGVERLISMQPDMYWLSSSSRASMWVGRWYQLQEQDDIARGYYLNSIKDCLLLWAKGDSWDESWTDKSLIYSLSHLLIALRDKRDAISMLQGLSPVSDKSWPVGSGQKNDDGTIPKAKPPVEAEDADDEAEMLWGCDGCDQDSPSWVHSNICGSCLQDFCASCVKRIKKGDSEFERQRICHSDHDWLEIPPPPKDFGQNFPVDEGKVFIEGKSMPFADYVKVLKERYHL